MIRNQMNLISGASETSHKGITLATSNTPVEDALTQKINKVYQNKDIANGDKCVELSKIFYE